MTYYYRETDNKDSLLQVDANFNFAYAESFTSNSFNS